jgi:hypothetical protein
LITRSDLERALSIQKARTVKKPIGTILVEVGVMSAEHLETELRLHIIDVVRDLLGWRTGTFQFTLGKFSEDGVVMCAGISAEFLLLEGARLEDESESGAGDEPALDPSSSAEESFANLDESTPMSHPAVEAQDPESLAGLVSDDALGEAVLGERAQVSRNDLALLPAMIEELSGVVSGHDVFLMMLRFAGELMNRSIIFLVRGDSVSGWGQFGVDVPDGSPDDVVRSIVVPLSDSSSFREVADTRAALKGKWPELPGNQAVVERLGGLWPAESFLAPIVSADRVVAFLYGDNLPNQTAIGETEGLEAFLRLAAVSLGKTLLQQQIQRMRTGGS